MAGNGSCADMSKGGGTGMGHGKDMPNDGTGMGHKADAMQAQHATNMRKHHAKAVAEGATNGGDAAPMPANTK